MTSGRPLVGSPIRDSLDVPFGVVEAARSHDFGFFIWSAVGFLLAFGLIAAASIGLPFLLVGLTLFVALQVRGPVWPADLGLLAGIGSVCLVVAAINAASGDLSPTVWLLVGFALIGLSSSLFWWLRCRPVRRA
jgi:hypothetical protein